MSISFIRECLCICLGLGGVSAVCVCMCACVTYIDVREHYLRQGLYCFSTVYIRLADTGVSGKFSISTIYLLVNFYSYG